MDNLNTETGEHSGGSHCSHLILIEAGKTIKWKGMDYPLSIPEGTIDDNAECNPGTLRVEDAMTGEILWPINQNRKN